MASRAHRRQERRIEAIVKGGGMLILVAVFGLAGIPGFGVVGTLVIAGGAVILLAGACFVVLRSPLIAWKRFGICAVLVGSVTCLVWRFVKAPPHWIQQRGSVVKITTPACTVTTEYQYQMQRQTYTVTKTTEWGNVAEASKATPASIILFVNPTSGAENSDRPNPGWARVQAVPVSTRRNEHGDYKAIIQLYGGFLGLLGPTQLAFEGPQVAGLKVGAQVPVYVDPVDFKHYSLAQRETVGGQKYPLLGFGILLVLGGIGAVAKERRWRDDQPLVSSGANIDRPPVREPVAQRARPLSVHEQLQRIDWRQFERVVGRILEHMDWQVELSGGAKPDGGADLIARKNGEVAVVQCKHWRNAIVQLKVVRELQGTKTSAGIAANEAVLFTLSSYTDEARRYAADNKIVLFDGDDVVRHIEEIGPLQFPELVDPDRKFCPKCDAPMVRRDGAKPFWGCSTYPRTKCRGTIEIGV